MKVFLKHGGKGKSLRGFVVAILCWLKRTERASVIQMGFLISVGIRDITMMENRSEGPSGRPWGCSDPNKPSFLEELPKEVPSLDMKDGWILILFTSPWNGLFVMCQR